MSHISNGWSNSPSLTNTDLKILSFIQLNRPRMNFLFSLNQKLISVSGWEDNSDLNGAGLYLGQKNPAWLPTNTVKYALQQPVSLWLIFEILARQIPKYLFISWVKCFHDKLKASFLLLMWRPSLRQRRWGMNTISGWGADWYLWVSYLPWPNCFTVLWVASRGTVPSRVLPALPFRIRIPITGNLNADSSKAGNRGCIGWDRRPLSTRLLHQFEFQIQWRQHLNVHPEHVEGTANTRRKTQTSLSRSAATVMHRLTISLEYQAVAIHTIRQREELKL